MTIIGNMRACPFLDWITDDDILAYWDDRKDTLDIARAAGEHESNIARRLPGILELRRRRKGC